MRQNELNSICFKHIYSIYLWNEFKLNINIIEFSYNKELVQTSKFLFNHFHIRI